jgi:hypothetical protein
MGFLREVWLRKLLFYNNNNIYIIVVVVLCSRVHVFLQNRAPPVRIFVFKVASQNPNRTICKITKIPLYIQNYMNNMNNVYNQGLTHEQKVVYICEHEQK